MPEGKKGLYASLEGKYYDLLDWLDTKGIPVYSVVDWIEDKNIPSFPVAVLFSFLVLILVGWLVLGLVAPGKATLSVSVFDESLSPVSNVEVSASTASGGTIGPELTDASGVASITVPMNEEILVEAKKEPDFRTKTETFTAIKQEESLELELQRTVSTLRKTIEILRPGTNELVDELVELELRCSEKPEFSERVTTTTGIITVEVQSDCGTLHVTPANGFTASGTTSFDVRVEGTIELFLREEETGKGTIIVSVTDSSGTPLQGIDVSVVVRSDESEIGSVVETKQTLASGTVTFLEVPEGTYSVTAFDRTGTFSEFDSSEIGLVQEVADGATKTFSIALEKTVVGSIRVLVKDAVSLKAIENATVSVSKESVNLPQKKTDAEGRAEFGVGEQVKYTVVVDKEGYLIEELELEPANEFREVLLREATAENSQSLTVIVRDEVGDPIENVRITLRNAETDAQVGRELVTGIAGIALFERVEAGTYYVFALKPGFGEKTSQTFTLNRRQENRVELTISIGSGAVELMVFDEAKQPMAGTSVKLLDFYSKEVLSEGITGSDGIASLAASADKTVYAVVTLSGYLPYITRTVRMGKDVTQQLEAGMRKEISALSLELVSLQLGEETVRDVEVPSLEPGQRYKAKFLLLVPKGSALEEAGVHLRVGASEEGKTNVLEKDDLYILGVSSAFSEILRGTSFTPPIGYGADAQHFTSAEAKWVNVFFSQPANGVIEVEAEIQVRENARRGSALDLWYRAWGKTGSYLRFPSDAALGSSENSASKQALYAQAKNKKFSVGPTNLCLNEFCSTVSIEDLREELETSVVDEYVAEIGNNYRLKFSINSVSSELFEQAVLQVVDSTGSLAFGNYDISTVAGERRSGTATGSELRVGIGSLAKDDFFNGTLEFSSRKEGTALVQLSVISSNQRVFEKEVRILVLPAEEMSVDILPKIIVPFINNNILVQASTEAEDGLLLPVPNASVSLKKDGEVVASGFTDSAGIFPYTLLNPNAGITVGVKVEKPGFRPVEKEIIVTEDILVATPATLRETLKVGLAPSKELAFGLSNLTQVPLTISSVEESADFTNLVKFSFDETLEGRVIGVREDSNLTVRVSLAPAGTIVDEPTAVNGGVSVYVTNPAFNRTWRSVIPAEIRIGFGEEIDDADCFSIFPSDWRIFTSTEAKSLNVDVKNSCKIGGIPVNLRNLQARLVTGNQNQAGEFRVKSNLEGSNSVNLTGSFQTISLVVPENSESTLTFDFNPANVKSASSELKVEVRAINLTVNGAEEVKRAINVKVSVNDLVQCLDIPQREGLKLLSCPFNVGYGNYPNNFGGAYGYGGYPSGYSYGQGYGGTSYYGNQASGYNLYGGTGYYGNQASGNNLYDPSNTGLGYGSGYNNYNPYGSGYGLGAGYGGTTSSYGYSSYDPYQTQSGYGSGLPPYIGTLSQLGSTYPNPSYYSPSYGGDYYDRSANNRFGCGPGLGQGKAEIVLNNSCTDSVEVQARDADGLIINESTVKIEKGKQGKISVQPAYFVGRYPVEISARLEGSEESFTPIDSVNVIVENPLTLSYRDCISVSPSRKLSFNNFFGRPVTLKVINSCVNEGVRLLFSNDTIFFSSGALRQPTDVRSGFHEMIENWAILDEKFESAPDGKTTQILEFEIVKALKQYCNQAPPFPKEGSIFQQVGNLRYFASSAYYSVLGRASLTVKFFTPFGSESRIAFPMEIEDFWEGLPYGERLISYGDPNYTPDQCVKPDALNFNNTYNGCIPIGELDRLATQPFSTKNNGGLMVVAAPQPVSQTCQSFQALVQAGAPEKGGCGTVDTISGLSSNRIEKNGMVFYFNALNNRDIGMRVDKSAWNGKKVEVEETLFVTVNRVVPSSSKRVAVPVKLCVEGGANIGQEEQSIIDKLDDKYGENRWKELGESDLNKAIKEAKPNATNEEIKKITDLANETPTTGEAFVCEAGKSGSAVYKELGFDKLLFDWRYDSIGMQACDAGNAVAYYCDATQLSVELNKKAEQVRTAVSKLPRENCGVEGITDCNKFENSKELLRFFRSTADVTDHARSDKPVLRFFKDSNGKILENTSATEETKKTLKELMDSIKGTSTDSIASQQKTIDDTTELLLKLAANKEVDNGKDIVGLLKKEPTGLQDKHKETLKELGITEGEVLAVGNEEFYLITFEEFKLFHLNTDKAKNEAQCGGSPENKNCWVEKNETGEVIKVRIKETNEGNLDGTLIDTTFMPDFYNSFAGFVVGVRNKPELNDSQRKVLMKDIKGSEFGLAEFSNFEEFYNQDINFNANLIKDGYSTDFRKDFAKASEYKEHIVGTFYSEDSAAPRWGFTVKQSASDSGASNAALPDTGTYNVGLAYDWSKGTLNNQIKVQVDLTLKERLKGNYAKNALFYLPVDGRVGFESSSLEFSREDYGSGFSGNTGLLRFANYSQVEGAVLDPIAEKGSGKEQFKVNYTSAFDVGKTASKVLSIDSTAKEIVFSPRDPVAVEVGVEKRTNPQIPAGFLYSVFGGTTQAGSVASLLEWQVTEDTVTDDGNRTAKDSAHASDELCKTGSESFYGFVFSSGKVGQTKMKTIIYAPTNTASVAVSRLNIVCWKDSGSGRARDILADKSFTLSIGSNQLNHSEKDRIRSDYTVKNLIEMVKSGGEKGRVCVESGTETEKKLNFYWNPDKIFDEFG